MTAKSPENRDELEARFQKILGRAPTKGEMDELVRDKEEMGLGYYDPLLIQLMSFKRERLALEEVFERHRKEFSKHMGELRDHVVRETGKVMVRKAGEVEAASAAALAKEAARVLEEQRVKLTATVTASTKAAVKEKFDETWAAEWRKLQEEFKADWKRQVEPKVAELKTELHNAEVKFALLWMGTLVLGLMLMGLLGWVWWERLRSPAVPPAVESEVLKNGAKPGSPARK